MRGLCGRRNSRYRWEGGFLWSFRPDIGIFERLGIGEEAEMRSVRCHPKWSCCAGRTCSCRSWCCWAAVWPYTTLPISSDLITVSTGIRSAHAFELNSIVLKMPLPLASIKPVGPLILSTQPRRGSLQEAVTIDGLTIATGKEPHSSTSNDSANAFV